MLRRKLLVISKDSRLRREVRRVTAATGSTAEVVDSAAAATGGADLVVVDARDATELAALVEAVPADQPAIYLVREDAVIAGLGLLADPDTTSVMAHGEQFDDDEFIASATKALRGDVFGLHKYFPWGVTTYSLVVASGAEKAKAIDALLEYASLAGVRGPVRDRIQVVADELMMNALYHAPVDAAGNERFAGRSRRELAQLADLPPIELTYGCSGRYFGLAVRDAAGSLSRERAVRYLGRARAELVDVEQKVGGAGLGLVTVVRSTSKLIMNLRPGVATEVIALFDVDLAARGHAGARSVHLFEAPPTPPPTASAVAAAGATASPPARAAASRRTAWILVAILLAIATGLGTAVAMRARDAAAAEAACPR